MTEFKYVGGGHYRDASVPKGQPAETLHGDELTKHYESEAASLRQRIEQQAQQLTTAMGEVEVQRRRAEQAESEREVLRTALEHGGCQDNARPVPTPKQTCNERGLSEPCWVCRALARNPEGPK